MDVAAAGVLCNPESGRVRACLEPVRAAVARSLPGACYQEATTPGEMGDALDILVRGGADPLIIVGGDGTVHAVLSYLLGAAHLAPLPRLLIVPAGTTNMTAADLGLRGDPRRILPRLAGILSTGHLQDRQVLRVQCAGKTLHGLFFGAGIIAEGVRYFETRVKRSGVTGERASAGVVARYLWGLLGGDGGRSVTGGIRSLAWDGTDAKEGNYRLVLATTLRRLLLGMRPYWGREAGPVHFTAVTAGARRVWRWLPWILAGRGDGAPPGDGFLSANIRELELKLDGEYIIDGQHYPAGGSHGPVRISAAGPVRFLAG